MKTLTKKDLPFLRGALILLGMVIVLGAAAIWGSGYLLAQTELSLQTAQAQFAEAQTRLAQVHEEESNIHIYQPRYEKLVSLGVVGDEKRLDWMETIRKIRTDRRLGDVGYEIASQQTVPVDPAIQMGTLEARGSMMKINLALLHEEELLTFLADLREASNGFQVVPHCQISRTNQGSLQVTGMPQERALQAECEVAWLTVKNNNAQPPNLGQNP